MNESLSCGAQKKVTSDSIYRINSISKNFASFSALAVENLAKARIDVPFELTLDSPVRQLLPQFRLPDKDWIDGGRDITLRMLASHSSGLSREGYSTDFNMVLATGKADAETIGAKWAAATPEGNIEYAAKTNLMFAPGQRAGYSNLGMSILASSVVNYYNKITGSNLNWSQLTMQQILSPLNMTHSFFGSIPDSLLPDVGVPGGPNWADLVVGLGYDPAAGMWSSANDLTKYLYNIWLRPDPLPLISLSQRRRALQPNVALPDGKQLVGPGWEIDLFEVPISADASALNKTYSAYGKAGDGGGWHSWIDVIPELGYGLVVLTQVSGSADYVSISPSALKSVAHQHLMPAFAEALTSQMEKRFAGWYGDGEDGGLITEEVAKNETNATSYAKLELEGQVLYLRELVVNGTSALEGLDRLGWTDDYQVRYFSTPAGVALTPAEGAAENDEFGPGTQVWRMMIPGLEFCDWFDFDGYLDNNAWPLVKIAFVESGNGIDLHYPPFDIILSRVKQ
ncbi:beta-lactamase/transpeptidase-like protein [Paraphaeosphaeria sporulosa]|uniref:Beta-lactamase/transpeptidase-like protein n=1 Tax=Paraphaeosphaeria sporulosa TaxID=1460663 RepID=A0A177C908_9PLEO|nr:beta-lactamase/transpeptidase-like protein [Paraphaeosphaeria sporulosa]OAG03342.1 beta-lactamase/transpeptidase-like protein [Paraphaeosphaeria sporulosa]